MTKKIAVSIVMFLLTSVANADSVQLVDTTSYPVTKVVDGDTFWIDNGTTEGLKIRMIGIDAPESRNAFKKKKEPFGKEARQELYRLIANKRVILEFDVSRKDRYQRTLAYIYLKNGDFVNALMVKRGFAVASTIPPNVKYANTFVALQQEARKNKLGMWK